jgi:hypothetical protein
VVDLMFMVSKSGLLPGSDEDMLAGVHTGVHLTRRRSMSQDICWRFIVMLVYIVCSSRTSYSHHTSHTPMEGGRRFCIDDAGWFHGAIETLLRARCRALK